MFIETLMCWEEPAHIENAAREVSGRNAKGAPVFYKAFLGGIAALVAVQASLYKRSDSGDSSLWLYGVILSAISWYVLHAIFGSSSRTSSVVIRTDGILYGRPGDVVSYKWDIIMSASMLTRRLGEGGVASRHRVLALNLNPQCGLASPVFIGIAPEVSQDELLATLKDKGPTITVGDGATMPPVSVG